MGLVLFVGISQKLYLHCTCWLQSSIVAGVSTRRRRITSSVLQLKSGLGPICRNKPKAPTESAGLTLSPPSVKNRSGCFNLSSTVDLFLLLCLLCLLLKRVLGLWGSTIWRWAPSEVVCGNPLEQVYHQFLPSEEDFLAPIRTSYTFMSAPDTVHNMTFSLL